MKYGKQQRMYLGSTYSNQSTSLVLFTSVKEIPLDYIEKWKSMLHDDYILTLHVNAVKNVPELHH
jgi:hypothetical protein